MGQLIAASNGALRDSKTGRIVANPGGGLTAITPATSSAMARARYAKAQEAAAAGLLAGVHKSGLVDVDTRRVPTDAWGILVSKATELAMVADNPRGVADLSRFVGQAAGMIAGQHEKMEQEQASILDAIPPGMVMLIARMSDGNAFDNYSYPDQQQAGPDAGGQVVDATAQDAQPAARRRRQNKKK